MLDHPDYLQSKMLPIISLIAHLSQVRVLTTVKYVPKVPRENEPNRGKAGRRHLRSTGGRVGTKGTEGLGFSTDAAPPWIARVPFRVVGHKSKRDRDKVTWGYLDYLILWLGNPIYYKGLYIVLYHFELFGRGGGQGT